MKELKKGKYQHFKGNMYELVDVVTHSETLEELVLYKQLYDSNKPKGTMWVRPKKMFFENVIKDGVEMPRFKYVGDKKASFPTPIGNPKLDE